MFSFSQSARSMYEYDVTVSAADPDPVGSEHLQLDSDPIKSTDQDTVPDPTRKCNKTRNKSIKLNKFV